MKIDSMLAKDKMPITRCLAAVSWLTAIAASGAGLYLILRGFGEAAFLFKGIAVLLAGLIAACCIRMFGNIGQGLFDLKGFLSNDLTILFQEAIGVSSQIRETSQALKAELESLSHNLKELKSQGSVNMQRIISSLQDVAGNMQSMAGDTQSMAGNTQSMAGDMQSMAGNTQSMDANIQDSRDQLQALSIGISALEKEIPPVLAELKSDSEQMNCDTRDLNQNIQQIRTFFEQIQRHLDLKK
ncbi:MAG: hypothetical protein HQ558_01640 [Candidatus Omnitrophica bacterium]|nr:hypothetical protein [Candidatus Omnitrophota bacterium]